MLSTLKRAVPDAEIDALVYAETAPMLAQHPALSKLFTIDRGWKQRGDAKGCGVAITEISARLSPIEKLADRPSLPVPCKVKPGGGVNRSFPPSSVIGSAGVVVGAVDGWA